MVFKEMLKLEDSRVLYQQQMPTSVGARPCELKDYIPGYRLTLLSQINIRLNAIVKEQVLGLPLPFLTPQILKIYIECRDFYFYH